MASVHRENHTKKEEAIFRRFGDKEPRHAETPFQTKTATSIEARFFFALTFLLFFVFVLSCTPPSFSLQTAVLGISSSSPNELLQIFSTTFYIPSYSSSPFSFFLLYSPFSNVWLATPFLAYSLLYVARVNYLTSLIVFEWVQSDVPSSPL